MYNQANQNLSEAGNSCSNKAPDTELFVITNRLSTEVSVTYNFFNQIESKIDAIMSIAPSISGKESEDAPSNDFVSSVWKEIGALEQLNKRMGLLLDHLQKLI